MTEIGWLRQAPLRPNARAMREHIDRLTTWRALDQPLIDQASAIFPRIRITDLLMEVDTWTGSTRLKSGQPSKGWEHINLTGEYTWPRTNHIKPGRNRPLRRPANP